MNRRELLLELAGAVGPDQVVSVPAAWLREALAEPLTTGDLAVPDVCQRYGRKASCVRAWLEAGRFPGAYRLNGREWRVPPAAIAAFDDSQQTQERPVRRTDSALSGWRKLRMGAA